VVVDRRVQLDGFEQIRTGAGEDRHAVGRRLQVVFEELRDSNDIVVEAFPLG
jgi:hypothetical protein